MNWQKQINQTMDYIENNLAEKIDYTTAAKFLGCSEWEFRRMFSFLAQMPLSEYVRRRRITAAIADIQKGKKIIDIAQRYGYESQAAFSRAFKQLHGVTPSLARNRNIKLKPFQRLTFKLVLKEDEMMQKNANCRRHIMGAKDTGYAISIEMDKDTIHKTNETFWDSVGTELVGGTALPNYGAFITEERCEFFKDVYGKKVLEIGCGTGHSLQYLGNRKASELWGLDISKDQLAKAEKHLSANNLTATLICSPMELECDIPSDYFDFVYSVYGIGWSTDLDITFKQVSTYLKRDGIFIFSWSHPIHKCVAPEDDELVFKKNYYDESWYSVSLEGSMFSLADRKMSTYINALAKAGLYIEELIEESDDKILSKSGSKFANKAKMMPVTFVIKARKL